MHWLIKNGLTLLIVAGVAVGLVTALQNSSAAHKAVVAVRVAAIQVCRRDNEVRQESNDRIAAHRADTRGLLVFLDSARKARLASYAETHQHPDLVAAQSYSRIVRYVAKHARFTKVALVNCEKAYPKLK